MAVELSTAYRRLGSGWEGYAAPAVVLDTRSHSSGRRLIRSAGALVVGVLAVRSEIASFWACDSRLNQSASASGAACPHLSMCWLEPSRRFIITYGVCHMIWNLWYYRVLQYGERGYPISDLPDGRGPHDNRLVIVL